MKKKLTALICTLAVIAPAGCSSPEPAAPVHTHAPLEGWDRNATEHWHNCECGEKLDTAAHELDDLSSCTVCGSEIIDWGDGTFDVYNYDENGSTVYTVRGELAWGHQLRIYDAAGNELGLVKQRILSFMPRLALCKRPVPRLHQPRIHPFPPPLQHRLQRLAGGGQLDGVGLLHR